MIIIDGHLVRNRRGEFFAVDERLPFGRPYGRARIGDIASADFSTLKLLFAALTVEMTEALGSKPWEKVWTCSASAAFWSGPGNATEASRPAAGL